MNQWIFGNGFFIIKWQLLLYQIWVWGGKDCNHSRHCGVFPQTSRITNARVQYESWTRVPVDGDGHGRRVSRVESWDSIIHDDERDLRNIGKCWKPE